MNSELKGSLQALAFILISLFIIGLVQPTGCQSNVPYETGETGGRPGY